MPNRNNLLNKIPLRVAKKKCTYQVAHQARTFPGFLSMKRLLVSLLPPEWDASPSQGYTQQ